jgi:hypothetical protein
VHESHQTRNLLDDGCNNWLCEASLIELFFEIYLIELLW